MTQTRDPQWFGRHSAASLSRILPRLRARFANVPEAHWQAFVLRMEAHFGRLFAILHELYGSHYDFFYHLEGILSTAVSHWVERPDDLKALDAARETDPAWFQSHRTLGYIAYVDLFAGDLNGLRDRIPYLKGLGVTYLHLMPLFKCPDGDNDGGYAISSYREVQPSLGTMAELAALSQDLRNHGISLLFPCCSSPNFSALSPSTSNAARKSPRLPPPDVSPTGSRIVSTCNGLNC
jgi:amylosucrase/maltose alpha-D-glucosyltransferase/alpha-amylase